MKNNITTINKAIIGPFKTASNEDAYIEFQARGPAGITFLLDPQTERFLEEYAANSAGTEQLSAILQDKAPDIKAYLDDKYLDDNTPSNFFDYSVENISVGDHPETLQKDEVRVGFETSLRHSHPGNMGVDYTLHDHVAHASFRFKNLSDENIQISDTAAAQLQDSLNEFLSQGFPSTGMETIGKGAFAHMDRSVEALKEKGILSGNFEFQAVEIATPYDGTLDHPNTQITFITERGETPGANLA